MKNQTISESESFLLEEYKQCWEYIKSQYEQRDKSLKFFIALNTAFGGIAFPFLELYLEENSTFELDLFFGFGFTLLFLLGLFTLGQIINLRITTTLFHKAIVVIRAQLINNFKTPLWIVDENPKFFSKGFNFFIVLLICLINGFLFSLAVHFFEVFSKNENYFIIISATIVLILQICIYYGTLKKKDILYVVQIKPVIQKSEKD